MNPHSKQHKEQQQDQSYQHLDASAKAKHIYQSSQHLSMSAKAKHFHMFKHPNYCEATNITCTKDIYSTYIPSAHKESTTITYSNSINKKFQLQQPFQTMHFKTSAFNNRNPTFTRPSPFYNRFYNQHISGPSPARYNTYPTFSGPANYRYYPQPHIPRLHTTSSSYLHQDFITRPHQQPQGHCTQQPYVPILILTPFNRLNNVLAHQTNLFNPHQY